MTQNDAGGFEVRSSESTASRLLLAPDMAVGSVLWQLQGHSAFLGAPATYSETQFLSSTGNGPLVTALELFTGRLRWEAGAGRAATSPASVGWQSELVLVGEGVHLRALDTGSGNEKWTYECDSPIYARPRPFALQVYVSASAGALHCLSAEDGVLQWRFPATGTLQGLFATAAHRAESVYFGCWNGKVYALASASGVEQWSYAADAKVNGVVLATDSSVYFGTDSGRLTCLDRATGSVTWSAMTDGIIQARPAATGSIVLTGTYGGTLYAHDAASGAMQWQVAVGDSIVSDLAVTDGVVYFTTLGGLLYGVDLTSHEILEPFALGGSTAGQINVFCGAIYAANASGMLYSVASRFDARYRPTDATAMLLLSSFADTISPTGAQSGLLPPNWEVLVTAYDPSSTGYATGALVRILLPSDDTPVVVAAFGTMIENYTLYYHADRVLLTALPATIAGNDAPPDVQVADSSLNGYMAIRAALIAALPADATTVYVTGNAQGGGFATLAALDLSIAKSDTPKATVVAYTFGGPAAGNAAFAELYDATVAATYRVIIPGDATPDSLTSDQGFQHVNRPVTTGQGFPELGGASANVVTYRSYLSGRQ
jgi:outer membrane protein assembly factor BamB